MPPKGLYDLLYLDYQATTPIDEEVLAVMTEIYRNNYGNPHSAEHAFGWRAHEAVETARAQVQKLIGAPQAQDIIFTSGATEANNLAIKGIARASKDNARKRIIVNPIEHKCALEAARQLGEEGFQVEFLPMDNSGVVRVGDLQAIMGDDVLMVILQAVNNEIGTIQPVAAAADLCLQHGAFLHCDAAQAPGRVALNVAETAGVASMSISAHKLYGPKGIGALYLRRRPQVPLQPLFSGGGQERGLRSGTLPTALVAGFGKACEIAYARLDEDVRRAAHLRDLFLAELVRLGVAFSINGDTDSQHRIAANLNINLPSVASADFFQRVGGIAVSAGSACSSADAKSFSHVLQAIGIKAGDASAHLRITIGRPTGDGDIKAAAEAIASTTSTAKP